MKRLFLAINICILCVANLFAYTRNTNKTEAVYEGIPAPKLDWNLPYSDSIEIRPNYMFIPLIFEKQQPMADSIQIKAPATVSGKRLNANSEWLDSWTERSKAANDIRYRAMITNPDIVEYNLGMLPEPPKHYIIKADPSKNQLTLEEMKIDKVVDLEKENNLKRRHWIHSFNGLAQFSQAYVSSNWYQGGNNNINILGQVLWNVKLNQILHPKLMFENTVQYRIALNSTPQDTVRKYSISEDLFQVNTKLGYKAFNKWYYSMALLFKTPLFNNYKANSHDLSAALLTPGELNVGLGMTYSTKTKYDVFSFNLSVAPLAYNLKICRENKKISPTIYGIDEGKHTVSDYGSNLEARMVWRMAPNVTYSTRLYAFTNYHYVQGDWENTFSFSINKYLSTQIYAHLRFDDSAKRTDSKWNYWQFRETLSFGLNYKFSM